MMECFVHVRIDSVRTYITEKWRLEMAPSMIVVCPFPHTIHQSMAAGRIGHEERNVAMATESLSSMRTCRAVGSRGRKNESFVARASSKVESDVGKIKLVRDDLLALIAGEERGLRTQKDSRKRDEIIKAIDALAVLASGSVTTDESLTAAWRMLWTTEKEQLFIVEKANIFGTEAGDILQIIDVGNRTLQNVITFPPMGFFLVDSSMEVVSAQRVNFKFTSASLKVGGRRFPIPPFGQGWFESVYLDDKIRVAKDIRNDYLVVDRAPSVPEGL